MNLTDYRKTPLFRVFEMIRREAARYGVNILGSELVGPVPVGALVDAAGYYLQLENLAPAQILELRVADEESASTLPDAFLDAVAADIPEPGGGSVAALAGALAAALAAMVAKLTVGKKKFAAVEAEMQDVSRRAEAIRAELTGLIDEDAEAYRQVMAAYRLPRKAGEEEASRREAIQVALRHASQVPLQVAVLSLEMLELVRVVIERGNPNAASDAGVAAYMAQAAVQGAALNVRTNLGGFEDRQEAARLRDEIDRLLDRAQALAGEALGKLPV
jgi:glutamate formiminotransferase/formiminotetrahydrofolate cyclodeaminase